ncbi:MAG: hypothetical protein M1587_10995 [Thaumarchaeota archaeon]|nr:hypothetical protein [Nitrososphaerota archaeon]MDG6908315.1 hypothetical protein [Nitrososphaerota archaeon]
MPFPFLDLNIAFDVMSGIVALLVSYYAFHYNRLIENQTLKFISLGFMLLGIGLLAESSVQTLVVYGFGDIVTERVLAIGTTAIYNFLEVTAYFVFALGYIRAAFTTQTKETALTGTMVASLIPLAIAPGNARLHEMFLLTREISLVSTVLSIVFLSMVVFQGVLVYAQSRNRLALLVLMSFGLILISNGLAFGWSIFSIVYWYLLSTAVQFAGFLSLLLFILWRGRIGST